MFVKFNDYLINTNQIALISFKMKFIDKQSKYYVDDKMKYCIITILVRGDMDEEVYETRNEAEKRFKNLEEILTQPIL